MKYKILDINQIERWIKIEVDFEDGSSKYTKRMMADTSSEAGIENSVNQWLSDYLPLREAELAIPDLRNLKNKTKIVDVDNLPKRSNEAELIQRAEEDVEKAKEHLDLLKGYPDDALAEAVK